MWNNQKQQKISFLENTSKIPSTDKQVLVNHNVRINKE